MKQNSFIAYLREEEKKAKKKAKKDDGAISGTADSKTPGNIGFDEPVPGAVKGNVMNTQQPPTDNIVITPEAQGNLEAYNIMRAFAMGMENNMSSIRVLKNHPTPEIADQAGILEKDAQAIIQYIMNMQIPL